MEGRRVAARHYRVTKTTSRASETYDRFVTSEHTALVLGGTEFVGRHLVERLVTDGWQVTLFNRGLSNPHLFPDLPRLRGDRDTDASALAGHDWDVVLDVNGYHPDQLTRTGEHLAGHCGHYVFVSTVSVYADFPETGVTEDTPLADLSGPIPSTWDAATYGALKVLCEQRVSRLFPSHTIVRPCIIAGPHDPTDRFTYWVQRLATPGPHIVPPDLTRAVQYLDVRDLATWLAHLAATRHPVPSSEGTFNAAATPLPLADLLTACADAGGADPDLVPLTEDQLDAAGVRPWLDLPLYLPPDDATRRGMFAVDASRAVAAGLRTRPVAETVRDTLAWVRDTQRQDLRVGLPIAREQDLASTLLRTRRTPPRG